MWVMMVWAISDVFGKGLGQEGLQRAFSTKGVKEARRSMFTCAVVALPAGFLFYAIGTALYAFYHQFPNLLDPTLQTDAIFPLFIAQQLPVGLAGLVISGLFAASMSTLDTAMNTSATIVTRDFYSIWRKESSDREQLWLAKGVTIFCGIFGTGVALYMASFENLGSLWDMFSILLGVIGGGLGGIGFLSLCTTRSNTAGTLLGAFVTAISMILIKQYTDVHFFTFGTVSLVIGSSTGYVFSLFFNLFPNLVHRKDLTGLTLWTPAPPEQQAATQLPSSPAK
jgi:Na+/proline symporter